MNDLSAELTSVAIIGGGPGGLMAAYLLEERANFPCEITLFEASERLGGKIVTREFASAPGLYHEAGAAEFYDYSQLGPDPLRALIAELGLSVAPMAAGGAIFRDRCIRNLEDLRREFGEGTWQAVKQFDQAARSLITTSDYYESDWKKDTDDPLARQTFEELLWTVTDEIARDYIRTMTHSDLACEPHQTSASYGLQNYLLDDPAYMSLYSIRGGNEQLTQELARRISANVQLAEPVVSVRRCEGEGYSVTSCQDGQHSTEEFDFVIVALPNDWLSAIKWEGEALKRAMADHHRFYDHPAHYLRVTALFDRPFWRPYLGGSFFMSDAFGGCCLYDESSRFDCGGKGILSWLLGGEAALRQGNLADAKLAEQVIASLPSVLRPRKEQVLETQVQRWTGSVNALPAGFPARDPDSRHVPEPLQHPGLFVMGDYLFDSTINGVLDSADTVVEWIIEECAEEPESSVTLDADLSASLH